MATTTTYVDTFQTRFMQSFVNLTKIDSTKWPAVTSAQVEYCDMSSVPQLTAYFVYDQFALRTIGVSGTGLGF
jgi:hypothetical protein